MKGSASAQCFALHPELASNMARLVIKSQGLERQVIELNLGVNRLGRSPDCDFPIDHPTVSSLHCEVLLDNEGVTLRDCDSTNGTSIAGQMINEARLYSGQTFCLGDVELLVESTDVIIAIPKFDAVGDRPVPPAVLPDGSLMCPRHGNAHATYQCTHCHEVLCEICVHHVGRRGGKVLNLCPLCSHQCEPLGPAKPKKKSFMRFLRTTVKIPFTRHRSD